MRCRSIRSMCANSLAQPLLAHRFYQVGQSNVLTASQVRKYAQHFIFWRRAIAVPPLHARDVYVVSPNCDLSRLPQAAVEWQRAFPLAPPLPNFLSELSYSPRAFKTFCPSKAHRPLYLRMLAWLMRGGWVTQLCTFAYVVVWPEILYEVDYEIEAEELAAAADEARSKENASTSPPTAAKIPADAQAQAASSAATATDDSNVTTSQSAESSSTSQPIPVIEQQQTQHADSEGNIPGAGDEPSPKSRVPSQYLQLLQPPPTTASTTTSSQTPATLHQETSTTSTTEHVAELARLERIAQKAHREAADKATAHARKTPPHATAHPSTNTAPHLSHLTPHIILDARKVTGKESRYLSAIAKRLRDDKVRTAWSAMYKYFDGRCALERVALQEDMKRKEAWNLLTAMNEYLLCTRHW